MFIAPLTSVFIKLIDVMMSRLESSSMLERGVHTVAEVTGAAVGAVLGWNLAAPELGVLWGGVSAAVGLVLGKNLGSAVVSK